MKIAKSMLAAIAALGLLAAPIAAQAAPARVPTPVGQNEKAGGGTILYVALAAFAVAQVVLLVTDHNNNDHFPASP
ncbi:MAG TPA: hypothetical protein VLM18_08600 [Croceibacterium sp.]|nr:hypothetical protein [Croceibacterium sp.]